MIDGNANSRLIIVSHRLPFSFVMEDDQPIIHIGSGGLVTALAPVLKNRGGLWVGYAGNLDNDNERLRHVVVDAENKLGFTFSPVFLSQEEIELYYQGFSNEVLWPLFHDMSTLCNFNPKYWHCYQEVNEKFADTVLQSAKKDDFIWVHDYQLLLMGHAFRKRKVTAKIGFFLHIPFPSLDIFLKLPWRFQILRALLEYDLIGFQTLRDRRNFIQCARALLADVHVKSYPAMHLCKTEARDVRVAHFPISIDFDEFCDMAASDPVSETAWRLHEKWPDQKLVFSVDRLDYTKGILYRLEAIRSFLQTYPDFQEKICFVQVLIPSRCDIPEYAALKREVDRLVGEINSQFAKEGWVPIHYIYRPLSRPDLLAHYRTSEVMLVTPVKDGMNLVAKEYVASQIEEEGVLILSEFAGASYQLQNGAILINPFDIEGIAHAIYQALTMPKDERVSKMRTLRRIVKKSDVFWWVKLFLRYAFCKELRDFPLTEEYVPSAVISIPLEET